MKSGFSATVPLGLLAAGFAPLALGDERWARRVPVERETDVAMEWPEDLLAAFVGRMGHHGVAVRRTLMVCDRCYAMQQLMFAHAFQDPVLQRLAARLMYHFEERQIGRPALH